MRLRTIRGMRKKMKASNWVKKLKHRFRFTRKYEIKKKAFQLGVLRGWINDLTKSDVSEIRFSFDEIFYVFKVEYQQGNEKSVSKIQSFLLFKVLLRYSDPLSTTSPHNGGKNIKIRCFESFPGSFFSLVCIIVTVVALK